MNDLTLILEDGVMDPMNGEILPLTTNDQLVNTLDRLNQLAAMVAEARKYVQIAIVDRAHGASRLEGDTRCARLTKQPRKWNQSRLKDLWHRFPELRERFLRIATLAPNLNEVKKLENTSCDGDLSRFRMLLAVSEEEQTLPPTVTIER